MGNDERKCGMKRIKVADNSGTRRRQEKLHIWRNDITGMEPGSTVEVEWRKRAEAREAARREKRNAARAAKGKPRRSTSSFKRSSARYARYLECDCEMTFGEWLKYGWRYGYV